MKNQNIQVICSSAEFIHQLPKPKCMTKSDCQQMSYTKYGELHKTDRNSVQLKYLKNFNKPKKKIYIGTKRKSVHFSKGKQKFNYSANNITTAVTNEKITTYSTEFIEKKDIQNSKSVKHHLSKNEGSQSANGEQRNQYGTCNYVCCCTLKYQSKMNDNLCCKLECKKRKLKQMLTIKNCNNKHEKYPYFPKILNSKKLKFSLLEKKLKKKTQSTLSSLLKIHPSDNNTELKQLKKSSCKPLVYKKKKNKNNKYFSCNYDFCDVLSKQSQFIDNLYCSYKCKNLATKHIVTEEKHFSEEILKSPRTVNKQKLNLSTSENTMKRTHQLSSSSAEKKVQNDNYNKHRPLIISHIETKVDESQKNDDSQILCYNDYCSVFKIRSELIDNLYCSIKCKNEGMNKMVTVEKYFSEKGEILKSPRTVKKQKLNLSTSENTLKRTHQLSSSSAEKKVQNDNYNKHRPLKTSGIETNVDESQKNDDSQILCYNDYCSVFKIRSELIDNLYCSIKCKNEGMNKMVTVEKHFSEKGEILKSPKTVNKQKLNLSTSENILKKTQKLPFSSAEKKVQNDNYNKHEPLKISHIETIVDESQKNDDSQILCYNDYCSVFKIQSELIDNLYCSIKCKNEGMNKMVTVEKHFSEKGEILKSPRTVNKQKLNLSTSENTLKRTHQLSSSSAEKKVQNDNYNKHSPLKISRIETKVDESQKNDDPQILCYNDYCSVFKIQYELIDNLYCSYECKNVGIQQMVTVEKPISEVLEITESPKTVNEQKLNLAIQDKKLKKRSLSPFSSHSKKVRNGYFTEPKELENYYCKSFIDENQLALNLSQRVETSWTEPKVKSETLIWDFQKLKKTNIPNCIDYMNYIYGTEKLFSKPFPTKKNLFKLGQKLEGIDPEHESLFCVMTVVDVLGYRIKLHFDGYPNEYDFWVNADCPDLFYPNWCEQNARTLQPPKNYKNKFDWNIYLKDENAYPSPELNFASTENLICNVQHQFRIGAKLEALDKMTRTQHKQLFCVATIKDIIGNRLLIHFDGWSDDYDYWTNITSNNIHPAMWSKNNGQNLVPPNGYKNSRETNNFSWAEYLKETNSQPVPEDAFVRRPLREFFIDMKIEVVDLVVPSLIRTAKIIEIKSDALKLIYDGFHIKYAYWIEDDSPDIHPIGWSLKTNHPVEIPSGNLSEKICKVTGCNGKGNSNNIHTNHIVEEECPYRFDLWKKAVFRYSRFFDRLTTIHEIPNTTTVTR